MLSLEKYSCDLIFQKSKFYCNIDSERLERVIENGNINFRPVLFAFQFEKTNER